tara:strand:+ start:25371 stop:26210 length:840 start_codon:yes stop_codon:yes gene_type:complete
MATPSYNLTDREFQEIRDLFFSLSGVLLADTKKSLMAGRLAKILRELQLDTYHDYADYVRADKSGFEKQRLVDTLTTNETYFFREEAHFELLRKELIPELKSRRSPITVWSAACSSGPEPYSIAMELANHLGYSGWQVTGSDISQKTVTMAENGVYPLEMAERVPEHYRKKYCLKGVRSQEGKFIIKGEIRNSCQFFTWNLMKRPVGFGPFDIIFLRNMLIYFNATEKETIIRNIVSALRPDGYLIVGHSEALNFAQAYLNKVKPTVYQPIQGAVIQAG